MVADIFDSGRFGDCIWEAQCVSPSDICRIVIRPENGVSGHLPPTGGEPFIFSCPWVEYQRVATSLVVYSGVVAHPDSAYLFADLHSCRFIDVSNLDSSLVVNFAHMFHGCRSLEEIAHNLDTSSAIDISYLFCDCRSLSSLTLSKSFDTANATNMTRMFYGCESLTYLDVPDTFSSSHVHNFRYMFFGCRSLENLLLPHSFTASSAADLLGMFANCESLSSLPIPPSFDPDPKANMSKMFWGCVNLPLSEIPDKIKIAGDSTTVFMCLE